MIVDYKRCFLLNLFLELCNPHVAKYNTALLLCYFCLQPERYQRWVPQMSQPRPEDVSRVPSPEFPWMHPFFRTQVASTSTAAPVRTKI